MPPPTTPCSAPTRTPSCSGDPAPRSLAAIGVSLPSEMGRPLAIALLGLLPLAAVARAEPPHTIEDELGTPLPAGGRIAPGPPRANASSLPGLVPSAERDAVADLGLVRLDDGTFAFADPGARFTAVVRVDGSVMFADRWRRPSPKNRARGRVGGLPAEGARALN